MPVSDDDGWDEADGWNVAAGRSSESFDITCALDVPPIHIRLNGIWPMNAIYPQHRHI